MSNLSSKIEIENFCKVFGLKEPEYLPSKYKESVLNCHVPKGDFEKLPWKSILGNETFNLNEKRYWAEVNELKSQITKENIWYYENIFKENVQIFSFLKPVKINMLKYKLLLSKLKEEKNTELISFLQEAWAPNIHGFVEPSEYSLTHTVTGRMSIRNWRGNILTLSKEFRNSLFTSKFGENGKLWYFDFVSLEPRTALILQEMKKNQNLLLEELPYINSSSCSNWLGSTNDQNTLISNFPEDIYSWMIKKMKLSNEIDRNTIKQIILPQIYGQNKQHVLTLLKEKSISYPEEIIDMVSEEFGFEQTRQSLFLKLQKNPRKVFDNFYGRIIHPEDMKPYKLFNYWIQSLSVDIALQGFGRILRKVEQIKGAKDFLFPVFFIHDAMVMDIHNKFEHLIPKMLNYGGRQIKGFEQYQFHLSSQKL